MNWQNDNEWTEFKEGLYFGNKVEQEIIQIL